MHGLIALTLAVICLVGAMGLGAAAIYLALAPVLGPPAAALVAALALAGAAWLLWRAGTAPPVAAQAQPPAASPTGTALDALGPLAREKPLLAVGLAAAWGAAEAYNRHRQG